MIFFDYFFVKGGDIRIGRPEPTVLFRGSPFGQGSADVYCESVRIVGGVNFYEAILACYFLYYIFDIVYPPADAPIFQQFDNILNLKAHGVE